MLQAPSVFGNCRATLLRFTQRESLGGCCVYDPAHISKNNTLDHACSGPLASVDSAESTKKKTVSVILANFSKLAMAAVVAANSGRKKGWSKAAVQRANDLNGGGTQQSEERCAAALSRYSVPCLALPRHSPFQTLAAFPWQYGSMR